MKVQIYSHKTPEDAAMSVAMGVNFIGASTGEKGRLADEISHAACRTMLASLPDEVMGVALTIAWELDEIIETVRATEPNIIHLSGDIDDLPVAKVAELKQAIPLTKIMQAIPVSGPRAIELALAYQPVSDYLILDTDLVDFQGVGATGATHDWSISAEIVRRVNIPVILAGGLDPENVAESIRAVNPWCVDSFSHTNIPGTKRKDPERVKAFVEAARTT
ncbi:MAG: phosphoribosylanthranilate isomerase [Chloroflexota bacterium]